MNEYLTPGTTVITYSEVLSDIQDQLLGIFLVCGAFLFIYALFNMYIVDSEKFYDHDSELPEQIKGFMDSLAIMFSLFICAVSLVTLLGIKL